MSFKTGLAALPLFWRIYIVCMILASFRMGNPGWWEWPSAGWHSRSKTGISVQIIPEHNIAPEK